MGALLIQDGHPITYICESLPLKNQMLLVYEKDMLTILFPIKK